MNITFRSQLSEFANKGCRISEPPTGLGARSVSSLRDAPNRRSGSVSCKAPSDLKGLESQLVWS
jgi:hypothetical protein